MTSHKNTVQDQSGQAESLTFKRKCMMQHQHLLCINIVTLCFGACCWQFCVTLLQRHDCWIALVSALEIWFIALGNLQSTVVSLKMSVESITNQLCFLIKGRQVRGRAATALGCSQKPQKTRRKKLRGAGHTGCC